MTDLKIPNPYKWGNYKMLMLIPLILIVISIVFFVPNLKKGIDLRGGTLLTLQTQSAVDPEVIKAALAPYSTNVEVRQYNSPNGNGVEIELGNDDNFDTAESLISDVSNYENAAVANRLDAQAAKDKGQSYESLDKAATQADAHAVTAANQALKLVGSGKTVNASDGATAIVQREFENAKQVKNKAILATVQRIVKYDTYSFQEVGSALSKYFLAKTQQVVLYAFILSAIVVLIVFRSFAPSVAVLMGAIGDVAITAGVMAAIGMPLTLATIATLLMLIGFSLDTDMMLTMRVYKRREGDAHERAFESLKTGVLMNMTTIGAFGALMAIATWLQIPTYAQIGTVAVIGGFVDFIVTWGFNAGWVLWQVDREEEKKASKV